MRFEQLLKEAGATLIRHKKHLVFVLANGKKLTIAKTTSDRYRSTLNNISDLKRLMAN